jgi:hypothetical protein
MSVDIAEILIYFQARRLQLEEIKYNEFGRCFEDLVIPSGPCRHYLDGVKIWRKDREELMKREISEEGQAVVFQNNSPFPCLANTTRDLRGSSEQFTATLSISSFIGGGFAE